MIEVSAFELDTVRPSTAVMTSPAVSPEDAAGVPGRVPQTRAPGVTEPPEPVPKPEPGNPEPPGPPPEAGHPWAELGATDTPMNPVRPMWTVELDLPAAICLAIDSASLIGMAYPYTVLPWTELLAAVSMPITWPAALASGPPESPGSIWALVCSIPCRVSDMPPPWSLAVIVRFSALMTPCATVDEPPCPSALPMARTGVPRVTWEEFPTFTVGSPEAP